MAVFVSGQFAPAEILNANSVGNPADPPKPLNDPPNPPSAAIHSTDSLMAYLPAVNDYIKTRFTRLETSDSGCDTIRKTSDKNIDRMNMNSLSMLKSRGDNNFFTRNLFSLIIKGTQPPKEQMGVVSTLYFAPFDGRKIKSIRIQQLDVFGPTFQDTSRQSSGWIEKTANSLHMKTTERKLRGQLLFNEGDPVNPRLMSENEKYIRDLPYIEDVAIILSPADGFNDGVDVMVIIKEKFEYGITGNLSTNAGEIEITDQNMFGIGHQFSLMRSYNLDENTRWGGGFKYEISDLDRKFIRTGIEYIDNYSKKAWNVFIEKKYISSKDDWAGGITCNRVLSDYFLTPYSYTRTDTSASYLTTDVWYGKQLKSWYNYLTIGSITLAGRHLHQNFYHTASTQYTNTIFRNHDFFIGSVGISKRYLFKNNLVYGYGITEDIPYGRYAELAFGADVDSYKTRPYAHFRYSKANILTGGSYLKWELGIGGYLNNSKVEQGVILLSSNYFSNFVYLNGHPYRFFVDMELLSGINRYPEEYLVINHKYGIRDYFSMNTLGTTRLKINIESVRFWEWNKYGFRFAHYFFSDAAFLSNKPERILNDQFYAGVGVGIRVHNESLVFNVLEIRLSWIPIAPRDHNPLIFNAFGRPKAKFDDFLGGKPQEIPYR
jgi:hypothetical protein